MGNPGPSNNASSPSASRAKAFNAVQVAKGSTTTNAQFLIGSLKFSTGSPGSFAVGDHISATGIQKGTKVTQIDSNDIYISRPLNGTLASGATVTILSERRAATGGPAAFELKAGTGISIAADAQNATGASILQITASGGGTASALAADDLTVGDALVHLKTTHSDGIRIDALHDDGDIVFGGNDSNGNGTGNETWLTLDGGTSGKAIFGTDVEIGDDLTLKSDAAVLGFGADTDVTLTHVADTGLLLNGAMQLRFRDSGLKIHSTTNGQLDIDADGVVDIASQVVALTGTTGIAVVSPSIVFSDTASGKPVVEIKNTTNDTSSAELKFVKDKGAAGADNDDVGKITFVGDDAAQAQTSFGQILVEVSEADNSDEAGKMSLLVAESDGTDTALTAGLVLEGQHATDGVVDVTIGGGAGSVTTIVGDLTVNGTTTTISTTQLTVEDDLITISKGNDSLANAEGSGIEIECTGATNPSFTYQDTPAGWEANVNINLASGKSYKINDVAVYGATTIHSNVTSASGLATVGALNSGSITSGFGNINTGSSTITTTGAITGGSLVADNITIDGNTISSTDSNGDITLTPNGTGEVNIAAGNLNYASTAVTSTGAELNLLDGSSAGTVVNSKAVIYSSAGQVLGSTISVDAVAVLDTATANSQSVANSASQTVLSYAYGTFRTAKFIYQITDGTDFESGEILVNYKGASAPSASTDIYLTHYGIVSTKSGNAALVTWDAVKDGSNISLQFTNSSGGTLSYSYDVVTTQVIK